jgi:nucleotide-binding universal stress UspA family protein
MRAVAVLPDQALEYLAQVRTRFPDCGGQDIVRAGDPAESIQAVALERNAEMIVMCTHARRGLDHLLFGSVAENVVRNTSLPVLLTKPDAPVPRPELRRILLALDGTPESERVLDAVRPLAQRLSSQLVLLHVLPLAPENGGDARFRIEAAARRLSEAGLTASTLFAHGDPARQILETARRLESDLIAITTHSRRGSARRLLGSVAQEVVRAADGVLLLRTA